MRKKILITSAIVTGVAVTGVTAAIANPDSQPVSKAVQSTQMIKDTPKAQDNAQTSTQTAPTPQTAPVSEAPNEDVAAQNKAKLQAAVTIAAQNIYPHVANPDPNQLDHFIMIQWMCVDKLVTNGVGYENYDAAYNSAGAQIVLGTSQITFYTDPVSCRVQWPTDN